MKNLIEALSIFMGYCGNIPFPTDCEHEVMYISHSVTREGMSDEDIKRLEELGFYWDEELDCFFSYIYG